MATKDWRRGGITVSEQVTLFACFFVWWFFNSNPYSSSSSSERFCVHVKLFFLPTHLLNSASISSFLLDAQNRKPSYVNMSECVSIVFGPMSFFQFTIMTEKAQFRRDYYTPYM